MREVQVYTRKIGLSELPIPGQWQNLQFYEEEIQVQSLDTINFKIPTLILIKLVEDEEHNSAAYQEWTQEKHEKLWSFLEHIDQRTTNVSTMLFLEKNNYESLYRALEYHVDAVVTEADSEEVLLKKMDFCLGKMAWRIHTEDKLKRLEEHEYISRQKVMGRLLNQILNKPEEVAFLLPEINKRYNINLSEKNYLAIVILVDQFELHAKERQFILDISKKAMRHLESAKELLVDRKDPYGIIVLVNYSDNYRMQQCKKEIEGLRKSVLELQEKYGKFELSIGVGDVVDSLMKVKSSLDHAAYVKEYRMNYEDRDRVYYTSELMKEDLPITSFLTEQSMRELCRYVFMGDAERIRMWYDYFYKEVEPKFKTYPPAYAKFCWTMYVYIKEMAISSKVNMFPDVKFFSLAYRFEGRERMEETEKLLLEITHLIQSDYPSDKKLAQAAMAYMMVHFAEPINLDTIAEACGVSNSYFSRKFKEQTGENYIGVLTEIRMKEAQRLLAETDNSIDEILDKLGYSDDKHFRTLFVNYTGMVPTAYRRANRKKEKK